MKAVLKLNIADVDEAIRKYVHEKHPEIQILGYTVHSWNHEVFSVLDDKLQEPRHAIVSLHKEL